MSERLNILNFVVSKVVDHRTNFLLNIKAEKLYFYHKLPLCIPLNDSVTLVHRKYSYGTQLPITN